MCGYCCGNTPKDQRGAGHAGCAPDCYNAPRRPKTPDEKRVVLLRELARECHNGAPDPFQEFYDEGMSPLLDRMADAIERKKK